MLSYFEQGKGFPVVFLHGNPDCKEVWLPMTQTLQNHCHCIAVDLPGFGKDAKLPSYRAILPDQQAKSLLQVLELLNVKEPVLLVVHDLGAYMAASLLMHAPEKVAGIIAINTTFSGFYPGHLWGYLWSLPIIGPWFGKLMRFGFKDAISKQSPLVKETDIDRMVTNLSWATCRAITRYYQIMYNPLVKLFQILKGKAYQENLPVKVLWGAQDHYIPRKYAQLYQEPLTLVENGTHWLPLERPDVIIEAVQAFVER